MALAEENPDEEWIAGWLGDRPEDAEPQPWHELYLRAWRALQFDRQYGALGGETPISYVAVSQYARDVGITGETFATFQRFLSAMDAEWLAHRARITASQQPR